MQRIGPPLATLLRRLAETPPDFLDEPRIGGGGQVRVPALVNDVLRLHGHTAPGAVLERFASSDARADRNRLALTMIAAWLLADDAIAVLSPSPDALIGLLDGGLRELAAATPAHRFVHDADRREELARFALASLDARPEGETPEQATDRLSAISSAQRQRLLDASRAAERRAREIREALAKKAAEESADKWTRE